MRKDVTVRLGVRILLISSTSFRRSSTRRTASKNAAFAADPARLQRGVQGVAGAANCCSAAGGDCFSACSLGLQGCAAARLHSPASIPSQTASGGYSAPGGCTALSLVPLRSAARIQCCPQECHLLPPCALAASAKTAARGIQRRPSGHADNEGAVRCPSTPMKKSSWGARLAVLGLQLRAGSHGPVPRDSEVLQPDEGLGIHREPGDASHLSEGLSNFG